MYIRIIFPQPLKIEHKNFSWPFTGEL